MREISYGLKKHTSLGFDSAKEQVTALLKEEGFGILTEIDVKNTLKQKLNVDFRRYVILGACNPPLAYQAFMKELDIGLLLPCNVVVYEEEGGTVVGIADPLTMMETTGNSALKPLSDDARARLERVLQKLPG